MKDIFLVTPPFTQLNTPYPATAYLKGFFNTKGISSYQMDLGIEVILALFNRESLENIFDYALDHDNISSENSQRIYALKADYIITIDSVVRFVQGKNQSLARQICTDNYLPQASRFEQVNELDTAFGMMGFQDKAKHIATLYLAAQKDTIIDVRSIYDMFKRTLEPKSMIVLNNTDHLHICKEVESFHNLIQQQPELFFGDSPLTKIIKEN